VVGEANAADDVYQQAYLKARRGWTTFQGRSTAKTWFCRIATNEANNWLTRKRFTALAVPEEVAAPEDTSPTSWDSRRAIAQAHAADLLTADEARALTARQDSPSATWKDIAHEYGLKTADNAAQLHHRGLSKLRVYLMVRHPDLCGSQVDIADAFERACDAGAREPLTPAERRVFRAVVLDRTTDATAPGHWTDVQSACRKVAALLTPAEGAS
jgi:DNA-directed RNA polymerase specialized sigma24 family protein